ncbi:hypothetical protein ACFX13_047140 [Malus domestica]
MAKIPNSASNIATSPIEKRQKRSHSDINAAEASYIHQPDNKINSPRIKSTRDPPKLQGDPTLKDPKGPNNHDTKSHRDQEDPSTQTDLELQSPSRTETSKTTATHQTQKQQKTTAPRTKRTTVELTKEEELSRNPERIVPSSSRLDPVRAEDMEFSYGGDMWGADEVFDDEMV